MLNKNKNHKNKKHHKNPYFFSFFRPSSSVAVQTKYDSGNKTATKNTRKKFAGIRFENLNEVESAKVKIEQPSSYASKLKASILNSKTGNRNIGNRNGLGFNSISSSSSSEKQENEENQEQSTLFFSPSVIVDQEKVKRERKFQEDLFRVSKAIKIVELLPRLNNNNKSADVSLYEFNRFYALMASITFFLFDLVAVDTKEIDIAFAASSTSELNLELPSRLHTFLYWLFFSKLSDTLQAAFEELFFLHQGSRTLPTLLEFMRRMMLEQKEQAVRANTKEAADEREQAALLPEGFSYQKNRGGSGKGDSRYQGNSESSVRSMRMGASADSGLLSRNRFSPSLSSPPKQQENAVPVQHSSSPLKRTLCTFCKFQTNHQVKDCPVRQATLCHQCFDVSAPLLGVFKRSLLLKFFICSFFAVWPFTEILQCRITPAAQLAQCGQRDLQGGCPGRAEAGLEK